MKGYFYQLVKNDGILTTHKLFLGEIKETGSL